MNETTVFVFRDSPEVAVQNDLCLTGWQIIEDEAGDRFLLGFLLEKLTLRMTTSIQAFDPAGRRIVTKSGRRYELLGAPMKNKEILATMGLFALMHGVFGSVIDVTTDFSNAVLAAMH